MNEPQKPTSLRWWEFYFVRYATGTVVGGVVFFFICRINPIMAPLLFGVDSGVLDGARIALFSAYGLAYCYIASAPMLVFHAGRYMLDIRSPSPRTLRSRFNHIRRLFCFSITFIFFFSASFYSFSGHETELRSLFSLVAASFLTFICIQLYIIFHSLFRSNRLYEFYKTLTAARICSNREIVESYRHLREHGNSFAIVVLEIFLATALHDVTQWTNEKYGNWNSHDEILIITYSSVLLLWVLPAALTWLVVVIFERRFVDESRQRIGKKNGGHV